MRRWFGKDSSMVAAAGSMVTAAGSMAAVAGSMVAAAGPTVAAVALTFAVVGCDRKSADSGLQAPLGSDRPLSIESVMRGARLYQEHCAQCHGPEAQGHPDWQNPQVVAAPPLNGTGNEWKRKKSEYLSIVKNGIARNNEPVMPGWGNRLSDQEIEDIVTWFQALWPIDVYDRWLKVNSGTAVTDKKS